MPELPEIEVTRRDLEREIAGRKFKSVEVLLPKAVSRQRSKGDFIKRLEGHKVKSFDRRGQFIIGKLDTDDLWVLVLGPSGRMLRLKQGKPETDPDSQVAVSFTFTQGGSVHLLDYRGGAESFVVTKDDLAGFPDYEELGMDPLETPVPWQTFGHLMLKQKAKLKSILTNSKIVACIGPIYSDEILFHAGLRYDRLPNSMSAHEIRRLYRSWVETLVQAIKLRGTSLEPWDIDMFGKRGEYGTELEVYQRAGQTCSRCRATIERTRFQKRYLYYCPGCQS